MDLLKLLADSAPLLTAHLSPDQAAAIKSILSEDRADIGHILAHIDSIAADGKLTSADIPDIVMFCVELSVFVSKTTSINLTEPEIFVLAENAVVIIISAPRFALNELEIKVASGVANTCFKLAKRVITGANTCSNWWMRTCTWWPTSSCCLA